MGKFVENIFLMGQGIRGRNSKAVILLGLRPLFEVNIVNPARVPLIKLVP